MTPTELRAQSTLKFSSSTSAQCDGAIADIHTTFAVQGPDISPSYAAKLYAELDAARDRKMHLVSYRGRGGAVAILNESAEFILELAVDVRARGQLNIEQRTKLDKLRGDILRWQGYEQN